MWRILFQNLWFKLVAIAMALLLWFHVATDKTYDHAENFPLEILNIPQQLMLAEGLPSQVSVTIRGKGKELLKLLLSEKKSLKIDAQEFKRGETDYELKPEQIPIPEGLELRVTNILPPKNLKIKLDYPMEKTVQVQPNINIIPAEGYVKVGEAHYNPKEIDISGPRMWVRGLGTISTQEVVIENATKPVSDQVNLVMPEGYNLTLSTTKINFSQNIEKTVERIISNLPVEPTNAPQRGKIMLESDSVNLIISGAESAVKEITPDKIRITVNCAPVKGKTKVRLPLMVKLPEKAYLMKILPDSVDVYLE
jgi:YbbR domain-containing protein